MPAPYYFSATLTSSFNEAVERATASLKRHGFGVLTDIDVQATMKKKLGAEMPAYRILGACNPEMAMQALAHENKIGTMLPCNVVVRDAGGGKVEVAAVDPVASMQAVGNPALADVAATVQARLKAVIAEL